LPGRRPASPDRAARGRPERRRGGPPRRPSPGLRWIALAALAAVLAGAAYLNALDNPFVYDDHDTVVANASLADLSNIEFILVYSPFRPVVNVSYAFDRWLWGYRPFGYHLTNVALHALAVVLVFAWLRRVLSDAGLERAAAIGAFTGAALFALHPLQTEAVAYVSGRSELMCAVWFLATLLLARRAMLTSARLWAAGAVLCAMLAIGSKETGLVLPVVVLAYDWLVRPGDDVARRQRLWIVLVPALFLLGGLGVYRLMAMGGLRRTTSAPLLNLLTQGVVIWRYVGLLAWPWGQSIMHGVHRASSVVDPPGWISLTALAAVCAGAMRLRKSRPLVAFGIVWFLAVLAPSSSVIALREGMAEHRVYLSSAGLCLVIAALVSQWLAHDPQSRAVVRRAYGAALSVLLAVLFGLTVLRNQVWSDPVALWTEATVRAEGMWEPHYALADSFRENEQCAAAVPEYRQVVALRPGHRDAFTNLGICLAQTGHLEEAERAFRRVLEIDPSFPRGYTNLGALALVAGDTGLARDYYREAIAQDPGNVLARMQLASLYEKTFHDYHAAARMCGEARQLAPSTPGVVECVERNQRLAADKDSER
jgi:cytochrome c-type biogenesis protein CcmH/NrfG